MPPCSLRAVLGVEVATSAVVRSQVERGELDESGVLTLGFL